MRFFAILAVLTVFSAQLHAVTRADSFIFLLSTRGSNLSVVSMINPLGGDPAIMASREAVVESFAVSKSQAIVFSEWLNPGTPDAKLLLKVRPDAPPLNADKFNLSFYPDISSDGRIIFLGSGSSGEGYYTCSTDGSSLTRIADHGQIMKAGGARFSPDGTRLVYPISHVVLPNCSDIGIMDSDGTNQSRLTKNTTANCTYKFPTFSPDGKVIFALENLVSNEVGLFSIDPSGAEGQTEIVFWKDPEKKIADIAVSPDGKCIAVIHGGATQGENVTLLDVNGAIIRLITTKGLTHRGICWKSK
ncbi:MAG: hypothetical protein PHW04_10945 [Candidatus Wallbacteria bacterium]|nr:hypothetical protein [Candidatus Wallbacteria bacterium]